MFQNFSDTAVKKHCNCIRDMKCSFENCLKYIIDRNCNRKAEGQGFCDCVTSFVD